LQELALLLPIYTCVQNLRTGGWKNKAGFGELLPQQRFSKEMLRGDAADDLLS
jgi:hypothetical protein